MEEILTTSATSVYESKGFLCTITARLVLLLAVLVHCIVLSKGFISAFMLAQL